MAEFYKLTSNIKRWQKQGEKAAGEFNKGVLTRKISIAWSRKMREFAKINFITLGHGTWPPLSPAYAKRKGTKGAGLLRLTDKLFRSLTTRGGNNIARLSRKGGGGIMEYRFGTKDFKAPFHQRGTDRMPKREVIKVTESQEMALQKTAAEITVKHLAGLPFFDKLTGAGFRITSAPRGVGIPRLK